MSRQKPNEQSTPERWQTYRRQVLIPAATVLGLVLLVLFFWYASYVLLLLFAGLLLAVLLRSLAELTSRLTGLGHGGALAVVMVVSLLLLGGIAGFGVPRLVAQFDQLASTLEPSLEGAQQWLQERSWGRWFLQEMPELGDIRANGADVLARATGVVSRTVGFVFSLIIVLFVGVYLAADPDLYTTGLLRLVPLAHRTRASEIVAAVAYTLRWWLVGQLITMAAVGLMTWLGLWALGIPTAFGLGVLAFLFDFVPNFGPIAAAIPGILLGFGESPIMALYVTILYVVVQQIESLLIAPLVHQRTVKLPPVLTIVAQVFLGLLAGPLGLLLATPLTAAVLVLIKMLYVEQLLGDKVETPVDQMEPEDKPPLPQPYEPEEEPQEAGHRSE